MTNEPLKQLFIDTVNETKEGIAKGVEIAMKEMPDLCDQIIRFEIAKNSIQLAGCLVAVAVIIWAAFKIWKHCDEFGRPMSLFLLVPGVPACAGIVATATAIAKACIAPKLFLIEYAVSLFK